MKRIILLAAFFSYTAYSKTVEIRAPGLGNKCLDIASSGTANGTKVQLWDCNKTKAQQFELVETGTVINPPPTEANKCSGIPAWVVGKEYKVGEKVVYQNQIFTVANDNPGYDPIVSHWFWTAGEKCDSVVVNPPPVEPPPVNPPPVDNGDKELAVYFQSWSMPWVASGKDSQLCKLPPYVTTVLLAFIRPDANFSANPGAFGGSGIDFSSSPQVIKEAVKCLTDRGTKVLLSVGGATYYNWSSYNVDSNIGWMNYLGADGIDLDYEDMQQVCAWSTGGVGCPKDQEFINIIKATKAKLPAGKLLTTAAWSTGAYGKGEYHASKMDGRQIGSNFGMYTTPLEQVGSLFDRIYIMAYDAGNKATTGYDFRTAYAAYRKLYKGRLVIGVESCPEAWGGNCSDAADAKARAQLSRGVMLWSWQKPGGIALAQAACQQLGLQGCAQSLPPMLELVAERSVKVDDPRQFHMRPERSVMGYSRPSLSPKE